MTGKYISLGIFVTSILAFGFPAYASLPELHGADLKAKLNPARANSAESWWVMKEDADYYYLEDRLVYHVQHYRVPKKDVVLDIGPQPKFPVNLKSDEVKYLTP